MEGFSFDNMLGENEILGLFDEAEQPSVTEETDEKMKDGSSDIADDSKKNSDTTTTEVVNPDDLFEGDSETQPESVGSEKKKEEQGDTPTDEGGGTSPQNFYSSIASALAVDGIFPNSDEEAVGKVDSAESFYDLIESEINARLDEKQQRISKALENGVEPSDIRKYENTLHYISTITDAAIAEESEKGETLRRNLIYQDFLNKGYSPEKAQKFTERTIDAGTDIEDAKEALQSNREYFQNAYNKLLQDAEKEAEAEKAQQRKQAEKLKDSLMNDKQLFGDLDVSADVRRKAFEAISKPVYKDPDTGEYLTALQKYEMEHRVDFLKYVGLFMTLTNNFKDFDSFVKGKVKRETRKGISELERTLNSTRRDSNGNLRMVTNAKEDPEAFIGGGFKLAL